MWLLDIEEYTQKKNYIIINRDKGSNWRIDRWRWRYTFGFSYNPKVVLYCKITHLCYFKYTSSMKHSVK